MTTPDKACVVLIAEDDPDDRFMFELGFRESRINALIRFVPDGEELVRYLGRRGQYKDEHAFPRPRLLLLDLNMPKKDGRAALAEIRGKPGFRDLPIVVVTTSSAERDREYCMKYQIMEYVNKPTTREELFGLMEIIRRACPN